jgi:hypothetical protein
MLCGKPACGAMFDITKDAKYKLVVHHDIRTYEWKFSDELYQHLMSKDMNYFWRIWSSKVSNKVAISIFFSFPFY